MWDDSGFDALNYFEILAIGPLMFFFVKLGFHMMANDRKITGIAHLLDIVYTCDSVIVCREYIEIRLQQYKPLRSKHVLSHP